jgi:hypothetical protein
MACIWSKQLDATLEIKAFIKLLWHIEQTIQNATEAPSKFAGKQRRTLE